MANIFIIHGVGGSSKENWFPWLEGKLKGLGHEVFVPAFPTPEGQTLGRWMEVFDKYIAEVGGCEGGVSCGGDGALGDTNEMCGGNLGTEAAEKADGARDVGVADSDSGDGGPIFIGHSLGAAFVLKLLEKYPARAVFLVAGFARLPGNRFDEGMRSFIDGGFDWKKIRENCGRFCIFHGVDDPYVKVEDARYLAEKLGGGGAEVELNLVPGGGHLNRGAGYDRFELLLDRMGSF